MINLYNMVLMNPELEVIKGLKCVDLQEDPRKWNPPLFLGQLNHFASVLSKIVMSVLSVDLADGAAYDAFLSCSYP